MSPRNLRALAVTLSLLLAAAAGAQTPGTPRPAQTLPPGVSEAFRPDFLRRDIATFVSDLGLDDAQQVILESLFADYEQAFNDGAAEVRADLADLRPSPLELDEVHEALRQKMQDEVTRMMAALEKAQNEGASAQRLHEIQEPFRQRIAELRNERTEVWRQMAGEDEQTPAMRLEMMERLDAWDVHREGLRDAFVADLTTLLNEEQQARWPALDRKLRRTRLLPRGRLSGESLDLFAIIRELELQPEERASIEPVLAEYERLLDEALTRRRQAIRETQRDIYLASSTGDVDIARPLLQRQTDARIAVRNLTEQHVDLVGRRLSDDDAQRLRQAAWDRSYPRVFRPTQASRTFATALELDGVDEQTRASITALRTEYEAQLVNLNRALMKAIRAQEPLQEVGQLERRLAQRSGEALPPATDDAVRILYQDRVGAGREKLDRLRALLTPEQIAVLPALAEPVRSTAEIDPDDLRARFDTDGDGQLSPTERSALGRYLRERRGSGTSR